MGDRSNKQKLQQFVGMCQEELKRTTLIGRKMISASKTNSRLHENYEELGKLVYEAMRSGSLDWQNTKARDLVSAIEKCKSDLGFLEKEMNKIRFSPGPVDISKTSSSSEVVQEEDEEAPSD